MKIENQVCNLELSKRLKELGVEQESIFYHWQFRHDQTGRDEYSGVATYQREQKRNGAYWIRLCSAFTVAELGEMLPIDTDSGKSRKNGSLFGCWMVCSEDGQTLWDDHVDNDPDFSPQSFADETEADARAKMLIYLIESKLVKP